jgi:hypothetical protein
MIFFSSISANILRELKPLKHFGGLQVKRYPVYLTSLSMNWRIE